MQWDLVCENNYLSELSQTYYQVGALVGELTMSILVDKFGRKWVHIGASSLVAILGTGVAFTDSYSSFAILRPFVALCVVVGTNFLTQLKTNLCYICKVI